MIAFFCPGYPVPKGSVQPFVRNGKIIPAHDKALDTWETLLRFHARKAMCESGAPPPTAVIDGPVAVRLDFTLPRARGAATPSKRPMPDVPPDADKLARAVLDPLNGIVYVDDGRIVTLVVHKQWQAPESTTGVHVEIVPLEVPSNQPKLF